MLMRIVLRIGGSVVASPINPDLIADYAKLLNSLVAQGHEVAVVVGGGNLARQFISVAKELGLSEEAQDEIAISVSRLYAFVLLRKLGQTASTTVPVTIEEAKRYLQDGKIVVMGGLKPGMTTDAVAALIVDSTNADLMVKATDQDGVYDKDPRKYPNAIKLDRMTFQDLFNVLSEHKHKAGIHQIIDPEAAKILAQGNTKLVVVNGFKPENILKAVKGKCNGTLIG
jgi:uridylate kinase